MVRKTVPLLMALAVSLVAVGGVAAQSPTPPATNETQSADVGVCVVGTDSPCNDDSAEDGNHSTDERAERIGGDSDSDDGQMWIPEDQNRDGEIDERFRDSQSNAEQSTGEKIDSSDGDETQIWIPEDQNRDGEIDQRFQGSVVSAVATLLPL